MMKNTIYMKVSLARILSFYVFSKWAGFLCELKELQIAIVAIKDWTPNSSTNEVALRTPGIQYFGFK